MKLVVWSLQPRQHTLQFLHASVVVLHCLLLGGVVRGLLASIKKYLCERCERCHQKGRKLAREELFTRRVFSEQLKLSKLELLRDNPTACLNQNGYRCERVPLAGAIPEGTRLHGSVTSLFRGNLDGRCHTYHGNTCQRNKDNMHCHCLGSSLSCVSILTMLCFVHP